MIVKSRLACPALFFAESFMTYVPALPIEPEINPVLASTLTPLGRPDAEKLIGLSPEAGMVNTIGCLGLTPKTFGPLMRGKEPCFGVRIAAVLAAFAIAAESCANDADANNNIADRNPEATKLVFKFTGDAAGLID